MSYSLALRFDTDSPEFVRGVEIGRLWEQFKRPDAFTQTIHVENVEMVMRIIEATGRLARTEESGSADWLVLTVGDLVVG